MDEEDDKHFCLVCNQTISGLLNYVVHRRNLCTDKKKTADQGNLPGHRAERNPLDITITENSSANKAQELVSHTQDFDSRKTSPLQYDKSNQSKCGESSVHVSSDGVTSLLKENDSETRNDGETSYTCQFSAERARESENDVHIDVLIHSDASEPESDGEELTCSDTYHDNTHLNKLDGLSDQDQLSEQCHSDDIPDNIRKVLESTSQNLADICDSEIYPETNIGVAETNTGQEVGKTDLPVVESEYGILSITVAGAPKPRFCPDAKGSNVDVKPAPQRQGSGLIKRKRKVIPDQNKRDDEKSAIHKIKVSVKSEEKSCETCGLQFNSYNEYTEHIKTIEHKDKTEENKMFVDDENSVMVKVLVDSDEEVEADFGSTELDEKRNSEEYRYNKVDKKEINGNISNGLESVHESNDNKNVIIKTEKGYCDDEDKASINKDILNGTHYCTVCNKWFSRRDKIVSHLISKVHKTQAKGKEKENFSLIEKYQRWIIHQSPFSCDICSFFFNSNSSLKDHLRSATHRDRHGTIVGAVTCSLCQFKAVSYGKLMDHIEGSSHAMKVKQKAKPCTIKVCKRGTTPKGLRCNICPSEFGKKASTRLHYLTAEHVRQKLAIEAQKGKLKDEVEKEIDGINLNTKSEINEELIKKEDGTSNLAPEFNHSLKEFEKAINRGIESGAGDEMCEETFDSVDTGLVDRKNHVISDSSAEPDDSNKQVMSLVSYLDSFEMDQNVNQAYSLKKSATCKYCPFETHDYNEMRPHYMKEHAKMVKICEVCDFVFPHGKGYKLHINSKDHQANIEKFGNETEGKFQCHVCNKKFAEEGYAKFHTAYYHFHLNTEEDVLRENGNSITRMKYAEFLSKVKNSSKDELLTCPECRSSIRQVNILGHLRKHTGEKPFKCNLCTDAFLNSSSLRRHLVVHFDCWERTCEICGETFKGKTSYNIHMDIHKAKVASSEKTNICHICGDSFYIKRKLREHMKKHSEKSLKCEYPGCLWAFSGKHDLKRHMLTHSDENPFICPTCGYSTKSKKYLKSHEKIHSKDKFFQCEHCPYKTRTTTHLRRHMRIHLGTKPFKCPYCSYACNTHDNIRKHILETSFHRGLNVYPCKLCTYSTNCTKEFRAHLLTEHEEITAEDLSGSSLAVFTGLFKKEEDIQAPSEGMEILPCKERKTRRKVKPDEEVEVVAFEHESE